MENTKKEKMKELTTETAAIKRSLTDSENRQSSDKKNQLHTKNRRSDHS